MVTTAPETPPAVPTAPGAEHQSPRVDSLAWALFVIWSGLVLLLHLSWAWFLIGAGAIVISAETARWSLRLQVSRVWTVCGLLLLASGATQLFGLPGPPAAVLLIALGLALLWRSLWQWGRPAKSQD